MSVEDSATVIVLLDEHAGGIPGSIGCEGESSDPAEQVDMRSLLSFIHPKLNPHPGLAYLNTELYRANYLHAMTCEVLARTRRQRGYAYVPRCGN